MSVMISSIASYSRRFGLCQGVFVLLVLGLLAMPAHSQAQGWSPQTCAASGEAGSSVLGEVDGVDFLAAQGPIRLAAVLKVNWCDYYTNSSYSVFAGYALFNCYGHIVQQGGSITAFKICQYDYCCGGAWC